ncbi:Aerotaxis receptor [Botrimarina colliarenosi]|uniref:Aerotaxis receptor n=1 Tax=Botrimarina colliarenosi TaxID=2528001 RepID=A0A5C6AKL6_9BACT|nr:PAS domain S-box protein [Botrimarina colliarenosi]TWT99715.1 Aerotaxis receptor [Botrimarina colliarenosi]
MITSRVKPIDQPAWFEPHELFFSLTDEKGRIRYGNQVFTRVSGYAEDELLGKPHNLIRHPDMPRSVFRLLWDYLEAGKTIAAYVKNLAADGSYYWVLAAVTPCRDGYLSVQLNPSSGLFEAAKQAYAETLQYEAPLEAEHDKAYAIKHSLERLNEILADRGFKSYDEFMRAAVRLELTERAKQVSGRTPPLLGRVDTPAHHLLLSLHGSLGLVREQLNEVFSSLDVFDSLSARLVEKHEAIAELGPSLTFLSLNTHISAARLGIDGAVLSVISRNLGERSKDADRLIATLMERMAPACDSARAIAFDVAIAQLEAEVCESFVQELLVSEDGANQDLVAESLASLIAELGSRCGKVLAALHALREDIRVLATAAHDLVGQVGQMKTAQLNGKIDIASRRNTQGFEAIFEDVAVIVADARRDCDDILELLDSTGEKLSGLLQMENALRGELSEVASATGQVVGASFEPATAS